jgi:hypothetical protein
MFNVKELPEGKYEIEVKNAEDMYIWRQETMKLSDPPKKLKEGAKDVWLMFQEDELIIIYQEKAGKGATQVNIKPIDGTSGVIVF